MVRLIAVLGLTLLISGCGGSGKSGPAAISVPNVLGSTQAAATTSITEAGLTLGAVTMQSSSTVASGNVISESPAAGESVASGSAIALVVSSGSGSTAAWTWESGVNTVNAASVYGTQGASAASNVPGARDSAVSWTDNTGDFWLFGGYVNSSGDDFGDLWRYTPSTGQWTWVNGANTVNAPAVYGTQGVAAASNMPGGRDSDVSWTDSAGNLWLFGGEQGYQSNFALQNDLWRYSPSSGEWTWMSGASTTNAQGVYGTQGVTAASNVPGARDVAVSWTDSAGNLWLFGGVEVLPDGMTLVHSNDLWRYSPSTGQWTWMSGSSTPNAAGVYGTEGVAAAANVPGARGEAVSWVDSGGDLWLFGGRAYDSTGAFGAINDLWRYSPSTGQWTWISGSDTVANASGVYGTQGVAAAANAPPGRALAVTWTDGAGDLWLFGGAQSVPSNATPTDDLNDLWRFTPSTGQWTWVGGASTTNVPGVYGTQGTAAAANVPGARDSAVSWIDSAGHLWLFGGEDVYSNGGAGVLSDHNDLWQY